MFARTTHRETQAALPRVTLHTYLRQVGGCDGGLGHHPQKLVDMGVVGVAAGLNRQRHGHTARLQKLR